MKECRLKVYTVINGERDYQDSLGPNRTEGSDHTTGEHLVMLRTYLHEAEEAWTRNAGDVKALHSIRKIAAIAVRCMEAHGAPERMVDHEG